MMSLNRAVIRKFWFIGVKILFHGEHTKVIKMAFKHTPTVIS